GSVFQRFEESDNFSSLLVVTQPCISHFCARQCFHGLFQKLVQSCRVPCEARCFHGRRIVKSGSMSRCLTGNAPKVRTNAVVAAFFHGVTGAALCKSGRGCCNGCRFGLLHSFSRSAAFLRIFRCRC